MLAKVFIAKAFAIICGVLMRVFVTVFSSEEKNIYLEELYCLVPGSKQKQMSAIEFEIALLFVYVAVMRKDIHFRKGEQLQKEMVMK